MFQGRRPCDARAKSCRPRKGCYSTMEDVLIVDSGGANLASLQFALERLGASTRISNNAAEVASARRVILPGVGSAPHAMQRLHECDLTGVLPALACPVLGICLGM